MKKLLLSLFLLAIASAGAVGQIKYQPEVSIGMSVGTLLNSRMYNEETFGRSDVSARLSFHHMSSAKISDYFSLGLGIGLDLDIEHVFDDVEYLIPLYLNGRGYLPMNEKYFFLELSGGRIFGITEESKEIRGRLLSPGVGMAIEVWPNAFWLVSLNLYFEKWSRPVIEPKKNGMLMLKVGLTF